MPPFRSPQPKSPVPLLGTSASAWIASTLASFLMLTLACDANLAPPDEHSDDTWTKSPKRGLAYDLLDSADLAALSPGVSWWYNWYQQTQVATEDSYIHDLRFIPMLWGGAPSLPEVTRIKSQFLDVPETTYLLVMNEPNLVDQANRSPEQAAQDWLLYEALVQDLEADGFQVVLVGPALNWGTMDGYEDPVIWMDAFLETFQHNYGRLPRLDHLAFHWYDYGLSAQLDRLSKYGLPIWVTEMANWNANIQTEAEMIQEMTTMVAVCESREDVFRYAWFIGRGHWNRPTYLFAEEPGVLTALGQAYLELPYQQP